MLRSELPLKPAENRSKVTDTAVTDTAVTDTAVTDTAITGTAVTDTAVTNIALAELLGFVVETVFSVRYVLRPRKRLIVQTSGSNVIQSRSVATTGR
jgi:hypothetical protein